MQRRLNWRNEHTLYKSRCSAPGHGESIISTYSPKSGIPVYDHEYWYGDAWDPLSSGVDYDFSRPFFAQFRDLLMRTPHLALFDSKSVNSSYCNITVEHKNCYLVTAGWNNEDSLYSNRISYCKNTVDSYVCHKTEFSYENVYCKDSHRLFFSQQSENCRNSYFLYDCRNCSDCVGCTNLRNKQYCIFNEQYTKDKYAKKLDEIKITTTEGIMAVRSRFQELRGRAIHRYAHLVNTVNVQGDNIEDSKNCSYCFDIAGGAEDCKYCQWGTYGLYQSYDTGPGTCGKSELTYEGISIGVNNASCAFGVIVWYSNNVQYGFNCQNSKDLFGCVGLRGKQYCILNRQYTKEEYEVLLPRVIEHMNAMPYVDRVGREYRYGEFFPAEISPYAYNEAVTQDYLPLNQTTAQKLGFSWRERESSQYAPTVKSEQLPQTITEVDDGILQQIIGCAHDGNCDEPCPAAFRITPDELSFYRNLNLPPPRLCPKCRHYERLKQRNPMKLWNRKCMCDSKVHQNTVAHQHGDNHCPNKFETTYAPDRPEIVYCEQCYNAEVA